MIEDKAISEEDIDIYIRSLKIFKDSLKILSGFFKDL